MLVTWVQGNVTKPEPCAWFMESTPQWFWFCVVHAKDWTVFDDCIDWSHYTSMITSSTVVRILIDFNFCQSPVAYVWAIFLHTFLFGSLFRQVSVPYNTVNRFSAEAATLQILIEKLQLFRIIFFHNHFITFAIHYSFRYSNFICIYVYINCVLKKNCEINSYMNQKNGRYALFRQCWVTHICVSKLGFHSFK